MYHPRPTLPLYIQIADGLIERIESAELRPGQRLPPERQLSETLGVTRMTLRQALHLLEVQGLLVRKQGVGTFVAEPKIERQANQLVPFTKGMQKRGYVPGARVILFERQLAKVSVANQLSVPVSTPVYYLHRLRLTNQAPTMLEKFLLPINRFPHLERYDLNCRSVYEVLETEYGVKVTQAKQSFEAVNATEYEAELLEVGPGAALMLEERVAFDEAGQTVEYAKDLYRGDRFRFTTESAPLET